MPGRQVRSGRSGVDVVVVGSGPVATALAARLPGRTRTVAEVPAVDPASALAGARVVVLVAHDGLMLATGRGPDAHAPAVAHTQRVLAAAREVRADHVVVISSALVHGAWAGRPVIHDGDPLLRGKDAPDEGLVGHLLAVEAVVARAARRRSPLLTVLRPAALVGTGVDTFVTRHFEAPRLLVLRGVEREWQFVHLADVAAAVELVLERGLTGPLTLGAPDVLGAAQVQAAAGMRTVALAPATAFGTAERLHRVGVLPAPAAELSYVVYPWTVASDGLTAAGFTPRWSSAACLDVLLEVVQGRVAVAGRRVGTRDAAALGAAGAAVALVGTAAIWRQARGRRR